MRLRRDLNPADIYAELGPITPHEARMLTALCPNERDRWFGNIYGFTTSRYARHQYQQMRPHP